MHPSDLQRIAVIGAGTMGAGIAQRFAEAGHEVVLWSRSAATLQRARERIAKNQALLIEGELLTASVAQEARARIRCTTDLQDVQGADFVSENVVENADVKQDLFVALEGLVAEEVVLSSNTSGIPITTLQAKCARPQRIVGMHWWNPPHLIPLVEVTKGAQTSDEVVQFACAVCRHLGKRPVIVRRDVPGFIGNRLQFAVVRECLWLIENGVATPEDVDAAMQFSYGFRLPVLGPLLSNDLSGLDVILTIADYLFPALSDAKEPSAMLQDLVAQGHYGAKTGKGWYEYPDDLAERLIVERDRQFLQLLKLNLGAMARAKEAMGQ
ncbi:MAG: 3-hydroxyacyl-CoA dehydrogenase family protein [Abditibacteriales bacterium]|nr:3-hydroxyacyl-CoA dehydrogenase family protein [Abditibacteriales bacterium]MDW8365449.1 3-hydroxyacyl-CoA dehydrogenase family protein [Abditibacteriales bacterium]